MTQREFKLLFNLFITWPLMAAFLIIKGLLALVAWLIGAVSAHGEKPTAAMASGPRFDETTSGAFIDPYEFERFVARELRKRNWTAEATRGSGDQGADVLAEINGVKAAIQCKLYSQPVGNKAVQEAIAARLHYRCDVAAVVTNSTFTPSARELARTGYVLLLHFNSLQELDRVAHDIATSRLSQPTGLAQ